MATEDEAGGEPELFWIFRRTDNFLAHLEFEPQTVQAVALWLHQMCSPGPLEMLN